MGNFGAQAVRMSGLDSYFVAEETRFSRSVATWGILARLAGDPPTAERLAAIVSEPADRLAMISAVTSRSKSRGHAHAAAAVLRTLGHTGSTGRELLSRLITSQLHTNLICSNITIPDEHLALAGRPVAELAGVTVRPPSHGLSLPPYGYRKTVSVSAQAGLADMADLFAKELRREFHVLADIHRWTSVKAAHIELHTPKRLKNVMQAAST
ncbi:WS/DGAT domain-containing protein [Spirillospora sp. NPDC048911]|uniref:WS/DGAT domain-containing protein n=1 Tax=Spirillospora sp. NPDC048911 TaxID=3364527 RepID=UPI00371BD041